MGRGGCLPNTGLCAPRLGAALCACLMEPSPPPAPNQTCRLNSLPLTLADLSAATQIDARQLGRHYTALCRLQALQPPLLLAADLLPRCCDRVTAQLVQQGGLSAAAAAVLHKDAAMLVDWMQVGDGAVRLRTGLGAVTCGLDGSWLAGCLRILLAPAWVGKHFEVLRAGSRGSSAGPTCACLPTTPLPAGAAGAQAVPAVHRGGSHRAGCRDEHGKRWGAEGVSGQRAALHAVLALCLCCWPGMPRLLHASLSACCMPTAAAPPGTLLANPCCSAPHLSLRR